jgi:arylsulfatase A-like enzyme
VTDVRNLTRRARARREPVDARTHDTAVASRFLAPKARGSVNRMRRPPVVPVLIALHALLLLAPAIAVPASTGAAWDLHVAADAPGGVPEGSKLAMRGAHGQTRSVLQMPLGGSAAYEVTIPADAILSLGYTLQAAAFMVETHGIAEPGRVEVSFREAGGEPKVIVDRRIDLRARSEDRRWFDERIDLKDLAGKHGTLSFGVENVGDPEKGRATTALWSAARILAPAAPGPNLLLITVDCLRADHVGAYGYPRPTTPELDRLAKGGVRFAKAYANAPMTLPSIPQLFTSRLFPSKDDPLITSPVGRAGIPNVAVVNNAWIPLWLMQGGHADPPGAFDAIFTGSFDARKITDLALEWLAAHAEDRFFVYLHYLDAHTPYSPPPELVRHFADPSYDGQIGDTFGDSDGADQGKYDAADQKKIVALYDAAVHHVDAQIGRLLASLEKSGRLDDTAVVITADHGEEFWDHGRFFHGQSLYDELLHVPLIVRLPGGRGAGTVVERPVSLLSVGPSLVEWAGLTRPPSFEGATLEAAIAAPRAPSGALLATATQPQFPTRFAIRKDADKLIESVDSGKRELFDLQQDPDERKDLSASAPFESAALESELERTREGLRQRGFQVRVVGAPGNEAQVAVELQSEPRSGTFFSVDRREAAGSPHVAVSPDGNRLSFSARAGSDPTGFRFDRLRAPANLSGADAVKLTVTIDGEPASPDAIALGAAGTSPPSPVVDLLQPNLTTEQMPTCAPPAAGARVCLWQFPGEKVQALPEITDPKVREKLRALGYLQ